MFKGSRMGSRNLVVVRKKGGEKRRGRGLSREELKKAGIGVKQALSLGLPVDVRRRTVHGENVKMIKQRLKDLQTTKKPVSKRKEKISRSAKKGRKS